MKERFLRLLFGFALLTGVASNGQISEKQFLEIDSLFLEWNRPNHPGGAIAVMKGNDVVFSKAYGLASLEYLIPNTTKTEFNVASVSKQFSSLGIVKLHLEGKLSIDDTIDTYIDGLADFGSKITIRQMMHHTSGLRSLHALFALAGWRNDDARTNEDLDRIMELQTDLNFEPGSEYLYCNTGYMFLANIIEKVAEKPFVDYMKEDIFVPLGMEDTYVEDRYDRIVPNNATSYYKQRKGFIRAVEYWGYVGSGNIHTTTSDLLKYLKNYYDPLPGWENAFAMMPTLDPLNDGSYNQYALGVNVDKLMGKKRIGHGGSIGGFRSNIAVFPEEKISIAIITNFSSSNPGGKSNKIAEVLFGQTLSPKSIEPIKISPKTMESYVGTYWDHETYEEQEVSINGDTLFLGNSKTVFLPIKPKTFEAIRSGTQIIFDKNTFTYVPHSGKPQTFKRYTERSITQELAQEYVGSYYSPEIHTSYAIHTNGDKLYAFHIKHGEIPLEQKFKDLVEGDYPLRTLKFTRENGEINGVLISNGRVRNLWFVKTN
ncbi:serine hydrolase domain-containing protein [Flagellimonas crocea]|uniref:serine hydrolase domain-containing protein n=1 Tax=Flagellimonas crocea TaxID=3067311 RepID=UPI00296E47F7|nr:serine hydrolase domain-containing protein [Muricauda sp. DH64]